MVSKYLYIQIYILLSDKKNTYIYKILLNSRVHRVSVSNYKLIFSYPRIESSPYWILVSVSVQHNFMINLITLKLFLASVYFNFIRMIRLICLIFVLNIAWKEYVYGKLWLNLLSQILQTLIDFCKPPVIYVLKFLFWNTIAWIEVQTVTYGQDIFPKHCAWKLVWRTSGFIKIWSTCSMNKSRFIKLKTSTYVNV